ncbi:hypothetical protein pclt_cds_8 [Pandoravirus celtis]|uniref:Uncharacterized protein n=1 Tax=Pandoravirus celtis TaxID=2568002 RepID=A0A4D6EH61_9VIRU|nr:hypothetical protein pclt_cds_8 [Pandoravirus celtis]
MVAAQIARGTKRLAILLVGFLCQHRHSQQQSTPLAMASTSTAPTHGDSMAYHTGACMEAGGAGTAARDTPRPVPGGALLSAEDADVKMRSVVRRNARLKDDFVAQHREVHELYLHFVAMDTVLLPVDGGETRNGGRFRSFSDLCDRGLLKPARARWSGACARR